MANCETGPPSTTRVVIVPCDETSINQRLIGTVFSVLLLGGAQDIGDNGSDIKDIGNSLDGWAYVES